LPVIKTIKLPAPSGELGGRQPWTPTVKFMHFHKCAAALLLDSAARWSEGETRQPIEWSTARELANQRWRIILSAGLTPENVARAVAMARPLRRRCELRGRGAAGPQGSGQGVAVRG